MSALTLVRAQVEAEVKTRLRSAGTLSAVVGLFVAAFLWIPDPAKNAASIAWETADGTTVTGVYDSAYLGASTAIVATLFLSLIAFYLVAGSVRRDRERRVGAILAATPLSNAAFLGGKLAAHAVYLAVVGAVALGAGLLVFARYGTGPLAPADFLLPFALLVLPCLVFVAALAVLFDVTPGLRGPGGLVVYFFVWSFGLLLLPAALHGGMDGHRSVEGPAVFDPIGLATFIQLVGEATPGTPTGGISIGLQVFDRPVERVVWPGLRWSFAQVAARLAAVGWAALPFGLAVLLFDRFDPARAGSRRRGRKLAPAAGDSPTGTSAVAVAFAGAAQPAGGAAAVTPFRPRQLAALPPVTVRPGAWSAVLAEARLLVQTAGPLRWLLVVAALAAALPAGVGQVGTAALLLLLAPVLSEVAARERLHGTGPLVFSQPGVPLSPVLWKAAAVALVVGVLGLPRLLGLFAASALAPERAVTFVLGLAFLTAFAVAAGALTGGGKLFTGAYVALWYMAVNGAPPLDFSGAFAPTPDPVAIAGFAAAGAALLLAALAVERRQTTT